MPERDTVLTALGQNVRHQRETQVLTQEKLAKRAGLDPAYINGIERGLHKSTYCVSESNAVAMLRYSCPAWLQGHPLLRSPAPRSQLPHRAHPQKPPVCRNERATPGELLHLVLSNWGAHPPPVWLAASPHPAWQRDVPAGLHARYFLQFVSPNQRALPHSANFTSTGARSKSAAASRACDCRRAICAMKRSGMISRRVL